MLRRAWATKGRIKWEKLPSRRAILISLLYAALPTSGGAADNDIPERLKAIVAKQLNIPLDFVTDCAAFIDDLRADSLETVELIMAFEQEFQCAVPDDAAEKILTVGDAIRFFERCKGFQTTRTKPAASCSPSEPACEAGRRTRELAPGILRKND
jgi:acyl carrier protein